MKVLSACLAGMLLIVGAMAQEEPCDPATAGVALVDLSNPIGALACRAPPSVNLTATFVTLTGVLNNISPQQLSQLPDLIKLSVGVKPEALLPLLSLTGDQLSRLVPLLTSVPAATLQTVFPLLASQPEGTVDKVVRFLQQIPRSQLERLAPVFGSLTENQVNVLVHALNVMPEHSWQLLSNMLRALGPVTDSVVAIKQAKGFLPTSSSSNGSTTASSTAGSNTIRIGPGSIFGGFRAGHGLVLGRKLMQTDEELAAAALAAAAAGSGEQESSENTETDPFSVPDANGCIAAVEGVELGVALVGEFGTVVCKFGADNLRPVLTETLDILNNATQETLAALPQLTDALAKLDAKAFEAFFQIPSATLQALVPVLETLNPQQVSAQLRTFADLDEETIGKMVLFLQNTPADRIQSLLPLFSRLTDSQLAILTNLMSSLSPGQITLGLKLLSVFGPAIDVIGQNIPQQQNRGSTFMIGPIRVTVGGGNGAGTAATAAGRPMRLGIPILG